MDKLGEVGAERRKGLRLKRTGEVPVTMDRTKVARATHPMIELEIQTGQAGRPADGQAGHAGGSKR
ncbi:hypothetical protein [Halochromatium glycolicum]|uniref:hypothetical protein n=1 Tax=Halochromatium glycolicum TaxID=85075 RepID=UPI00190D2800|nr:hypothetical protein [Halochromatium glycolicum]